MTIQQTLVMASLLLLSGAPVMAQNEKEPATNSTVLPGEEKLSAQERAERDFLMPVRRKHAEDLRIAALEESTTLRAVAETPVGGEPPKTANAPEAAKTRTVSAAPRRTSRRPASSSRHRSSASKKKVVHKSSSSKRKTITKKSSSRRH